MELTNDLAKIKSLSEKNYQKIIESISDEKKASEWGRLYKDVVKEEKTEASIEALFRFLEFISGNVAESTNLSRKVLELDEYLSGLLENEQDAILGWERLKNSMSKLEGFFLQKKEDSIKSRFSRLTNFKIVTDIRPIFNINEDSIYKMTFPNIIKVETCDGKEFVCEFYEDMLDELINELNLAKDKLQLIKKVIV